MTKFDIYTQEDLAALTSRFGSDFLYHGSPQTLATLGRLAKTGRPVLMPRLARNRATPTDMHIPRHHDRLMSVGFYDMQAAGAAAMRALLHPDNHPTLAPVDCAHGYEISPKGDNLSYRATPALVGDTNKDTTGTLFTTTRQELEAVNHIPGYEPDGIDVVDYSGQTGVDPHDYWAMAPIVSHNIHEITVHGSFFREQLDLGNVSIGELFRADYNRV